tara:strand:- start:1110 stop:1514 length:405 start_codon:yes stop_codon:yes gene_type:complete
VVLVEAKILRRWLTDRENDGAEEAMRVMAKKTAVVVLQGAAEDPEEQEFVLEAVRSRLVANVIRYPLVKQNTVNLWQHAVRKMIQDKSNAKMLATLKRSSSVAEENQPWAMKVRLCREAIMNESFRLWLEAKRP